MPRKSRDFYISNFYHLMVQGDEKKFIFDKGYHKDKYIYLLKRNAFINDVKLIAYCIMDNHAHILVHSKEINRISKMMLQCNTSYGLYYNKKRKKVGHVFRERFRSEPIYTKNYLINCIKYIHQNPVKAKIEKNCGDYQYSSFNEYLNQAKFLYDDINEVCDFYEEDFKDIKTDVPKCNSLFLLLSILQSSLTKIYYYLLYLDTHLKIA